MDIEAIKKNPLQAHGVAMIGVFNHLRHHYNTKAYQITVKTPSFQRYYTINVGPFSDRFMELSIGGMWGCYAKIDTLDFGINPRWRIRHHHDSAISEEIAFNSKSISGHYQSGKVRRYQKFYFNGHITDDKNIYVEAGDYKVKYDSEITRAA